ncbi:hypothetical protein [Viscerimonas tarda]
MANTGGLYVGRHEFIQYPTIEEVIKNKINSDFSEINTYDELLDKLENFKSDKNIEFLKEISGLQFNVKLHESAIKQSIRPILKYIKKYPSLKGAVPAKYLPVGLKQKAKNTVAEIKNTKQNFLWFVISLAIIIALVIGYWAGCRDVLKLNMEKSVEQPTETKTDTTIPELQQEVVAALTNDTLHLFGKISSTDKIDIPLQYTDKSLLIKPLFDKVTSNGFTIDSIKLQSGKKIVFPKIEGNASQKLFAVFDSLNIAFPAAVEHTTDNLILYSKGISYKCFNDTAQLRVIDVLKFIPSTNTVDSVAIDGISIQIDNAEFVTFNGGNKRALNNFTYVLWLLNEIQKQDNTQTIKY